MAVFVSLCCRLGRRRSRLLGDFFNVHDIAFLVDVVPGHANKAIHQREQRVILAHSDILSRAKLETTLPYDNVPCHYV